MNTIANIKSIQKKCEMAARDSEVIKVLDLAGSYGDVSPQMIGEYNKEYIGSLIELKQMIEEYVYY